MSIELLLTVVGAVIAVIAYQFQMKSAIDQMKKDMDGNFERHREEHQEHHKEIAKMFHEMDGKLTDHICEERVARAKGKECKCGE